MAEVGVTLSVVLKAENAALWGCGSTRQLCVPHLSESQILLPLPEESGQKQMT